MGEAGRGSGGLEMISRRIFLHAVSAAIIVASVVDNFEFEQNQNKLRWGSEYSDYRHKFGIGLKFNHSNGETYRYFVKRRVTWIGDVPTEIERSMKAEVLRWIRRVV